MAPEKERISILLKRTQKQTISMQNPYSFILVTTIQLPFKPFIQTRNKKTPHVSGMSLFRLERPAGIEPV